MNEQTLYLDVAAITADNITGNAIITFKLKNNAQTTKISCTDHRQEPLIYPLLFPYGERGWGPDLIKNNKISINSYLCSRLLMPDRKERDQVLKFPNGIGNQDLPCNRFQLMARL